VTGPERARQDLAEILTGGRVEVDDAIASMLERGHPKGRTDRARAALGVKLVREGPPGSRQKFWWRLPDICPTCLRSFAPVGPNRPTMWGSHRGVDGDYWAEYAPLTEQESTREEPPREVVARVPLEPDGPPRCDRCGMAAAADRGMACPYWPGGRRCLGTLR
jgi:hypothetical protein